VSKRISELEAQLGIQLLVRTNKGVEPTAAGIGLLNLARSALFRLDEISMQMQEYATGARGLVRILANISAITQFLPQDIKSFLEKHPHVKIQLQESISGDIVKAVSENSADIGVFTVAPYREFIEVFPYHADHLTMIAPKGHPLTRRRGVRFADALDYDFVGFHTGSSINLLLLKAAGELGRPLRMRIEVLGFDALCYMVSSGLGVAVLPETVARTFAGVFGLRTIRLDEPWASRELRLGVRSYEGLPVAAKLLVDHLRR
ncbi:MAG: LysR family transcriptional regulator, partial [Holophaga sp.]|nr:LysR family transcriptional regulator [Holophaga sp.]